MTLLARGAILDLGDCAPAKQRKATGLTFSVAGAVKHLRSVDNDLALLMKAAGSFSVRCEIEPNPFPELLRSIIFQQLNGTAARAIHGRVLALFNGEVPNPKQILAIDQDLLRSTGVSGSKAASIYDLAEKYVAGLIPDGKSLAKLSDTEIVERLTMVRGVGPWTVQMLLMFQLGRADILPTGDFGVRAGYALLRGKDTQATPTEFREETKHWKPYRSVASWYMWRAVDLQRLGQLPCFSVSN